MASVSGRPYTAGFTFRIIAASYTSSLNVVYVTEYNYHKNTLALESTTQLLTTQPQLSQPQSLMRGDFLEFTAGRNKDQFTVVAVRCDDRCEVRVLINVYHNTQFCRLFVARQHVCTGIQTVVLL